MFTRYLQGGVVLPQQGHPKAGVFEDRLDHLSTVSSPPVDNCPVCPQHPKQSAV